jgi:putative DNA primase/helicase
MISNAVTTMNPHTTEDDGDTRLLANASQQVILDRRDPLPSARALIKFKYKFGNKTTLHHYRGDFYRWNGACYEAADQDFIHAQIWSFLENAFHQKSAAELGPFQPNRARVNDIFSALAAASNLPAKIEAPTWLEQQDDFPPALEFLPVKNGLLHLVSGNLLLASPYYFGLNCAGVAYNIDAPAPSEWLKFLNQVWENDQQSIDTLQELFGYFLTASTTHQKIALLVGPKRSGKGTIGKILTALLGQNNVASPTLASLSTNFGLAPLIGKSLAIIGDARLSAKADQAAIAERLLSISGEDNLTIDRKFKSAWTGRLRVRFMIMTNELPRLTDASGALASRFIVLTMDRSFYGREDQGLAERLIAELPGILNWSLTGNRRLRRRLFPTTRKRHRCCQRSGGAGIAGRRVCQRNLRGRTRFSLFCRTTLSRMGGVEYTERTQGARHGAKFWARSTCSCSWSEDEQAPRRWTANAVLQRYLY